MSSAIDKTLRLILETVEGSAESLMNKILNDISIHSEEIEKINPHNWNVVFDELNEFDVEDLKENQNNKIFSAFNFTTNASFWDDGDTQREPSGVAWVLEDSTWSGYLNLTDFVSVDLETFDSQEELSDFVKDAIIDEGYIDIKYEKEIRLLKSLAAGEICQIQNMDWKPLDDFNCFSASTGSFYIEFGIENEFDEDGDLNDSGDRIKLSIRDHAPSPVREARFGEVNSYYEVNWQDLEDVKESIYWLFDKVAFYQKQEKDFQSE